MEESKPHSIPANPTNRPIAAMAPKSDADRIKMENTPFNEAVGSLMYLLAMFRPDISMAVNQIASFVSNPGTGHWEATQLIFAYIAGTLDYGI